jgi:hypothetical protein
VEWSFVSKHVLLRVEHVYTQVRVVMLYGRSSITPVWSRRAPVPVDVLYMHEKPAPGVNCPQEVRMCRM